MFSDLNMYSVMETEPWGHCVKLYVLSAVSFNCMYEVLNGASRTLNDGAVLLTQILAYL